MFQRARLSEVLAYTTRDNHCSRAVMERLQLKRDPSRDFVQHNKLTGDWRVWAARAVN